MSMVDMTLPEAFITGFGWVSVIVALALVCRGGIRLIKSSHERAGVCILLGALFVALTSLEAFFSIGWFLLFPQQGGQHFSDVVGTIGLIAMGGIVLVFS